MDHPAEAADLQNKYAKALNKQITIAELAIVKRLSDTPDTRKHGYGWFSAAKIKKTVDLISKHAKMGKIKVRAEDMYDLSFLPKKPIMP